MEFHEHISDVWLLECCVVTACKRVLQTSFVRKLRHDVPLTLTELVLAHAELRIDFADLFVDAFLLQQRLHKLASKPVQSRLKMIIVYFELVRCFQIGSAGIGLTSPAIDEVFVFSVRRVLLGALEKHVLQEMSYTCIPIRVAA